MLNLWQLTTELEVFKEEKLETFTKPSFHGHWLLEAHILALKTKGTWQLAHMATGNLASAWQTLVATW